MINFNTTKEQGKLIAAIAKRANLELACDTLSTTMDLAATINHGCPLDLEKLRDADRFNFAHDIFGIASHIDRSDSSPTGGQLLDHFHPRFALPETNHQENL